MGTSPTQRTLSRLRKAGYQCAITERWCPHSRRHKDLFNFIDLVAIKPNRIIGVQATSGTNVAARITKIHAEPLAQAWLDAGGEILVIGWRKLKQKKKDGTLGCAVRWKPKVVRITSIPADPESA